MVADAVYRSLGDPAPPTLYVPLAQSDFPYGLTGINLIVRAADVGSPAALSRRLADALSAADPDLTFSFSSMDDRVGAALVQERLIATLSGVFGAVALLLAGLGLFGVTSYAVGRQRLEIAIRLALGAAPGLVIRLVMARLSMLVGLGIVVGLVATLWASQFVATLLYGLEPRDPVTLATAVGIVIVIALCAGWSPAAHALRSNPAEVLRQG